MGAGPTYLGPGPSYTGGASYTSDLTYLGPLSYLGPATYTGTVSYSGQVTYLGPGTYTGGPFPFSPGVIPTPQGSAPNFFGTRSFTNPNAVPFLGPVTNFNASVNYNATGVPYDDPLGAPYVGESPSSFVSPPGPFANVDGAGFINPDGISFSVTYEGTTFISVAYEADYLGAASYLGPVTYDSTATNYDSTVYSGTDTYTGTVAYEGTRVAPTTSTISTRTLWRRIA